MGGVLVAGVANLETIVNVGPFPVPYSSSNLTDVGENVSGVGFNVAAALSALGSEVTFATFLGNDGIGKVVEFEVRNRGLLGRGVVALDGQTPRSVILHDALGNRSVYTDLADVPTAVYPEDVFRELLQQVNCAVLTNIGFTRPLLPIARSRGVLVATDVHAISDIQDPYNADYMRQADVLFMSGEGLRAEPGDWLELVMKTYSQCQIAVVGMGSAGCCMQVRGGRPRLVAADTPRAVVNTVGAGDALFASFLHYFVGGMTPGDAIERAVCAAGWKVGASGGAQGFPTSQTVADLVRARQASGIV